MGDLRKWGKIFGWWKRTIILDIFQLSIHAQKHPTLCNPVDCSLPGSSAHGIFQARILEWIPFPSPEEGFPVGSDDKESTCNAGYPDSTPGSGRCPGEGNGNPLQSSCLGNLMDRAVWRATAHGVAKSQTRLSDSHLHTFFSLSPGALPQPRDRTHIP